MRRAGFVHAFSTRLAGSLSIDNDTGGGNAVENRERFVESLGVSWPIKTLRQTHSDTIVLAESALENEEGDALVAIGSALFVGVKTADCVPILIADPKTKAMAAVHAGWRGTLQRIVEKTIEELSSRFGANAEDMIAAIGPAACGRCYEIGNDVADQFRGAFDDVRAFLLPASEPDKFLLNVPAANATQLIRAKVRAENVHMLTYCTMHQNDLFFSHRKDGERGEQVGRQLSVIGRP